MKVKSTSRSIVLIPESKYDGYKVGVLSMGMAHRLTLNTDSQEIEAIEILVDDFVEKLMKLPKPTS